MNGSTAPALLKAALDMAQTPLAVAEETAGMWTVTLANQAFIQLFGPVSNDDSADFSSRMASLHGAIDVIQSAEGSNHAIVNTSGSRRYRVESRLIEDAGVRAILLSLSPVQDAFSVEKDLRSAIQQLQDLADNCTALMYIKDLDGHYLVVNRFFSRVFGLSSDYIIGRSDRDIFTDDLAAKYIENDRQVVQSGLPIELEEPYGIAHGKPDPDRRWLSIKFPLIDEDGMIYAIGGISTDITDRKRAEIDAREARLEAERANKSKDDFLSRMSHELRTPLNAILGFAQLLQQQPQGDAAAKQVKHIQEAGDHLLSLVNEALDISRIETGSPGISLSTMAAVRPIHQALEILRPLAIGRGIEMASDLHEALYRRITADPQRLLQVLINVVANAIKFNRPNGYVHISCQEIDSMLRYRVTDTGAGFSEVESLSLFTPFARLPAATDVEGSGLGLYLSRDLIERMGGRIGIERTSPGEGSTFFVDVPLAATDAELPEPPSAERPHIGLPSLNDARIVQIEDTSANRELVMSVVQAMGDAEVFSASTGQDGIDLVRRTHPDVVLLDLNLPDMPGRAVLAELKSDPNTSAIPVLVMSADASPSRIDELRRLGVVGYITKPIDIVHFATALTEAIRQ